MRNQGQPNVHQDLGTAIEVSNVTYAEINDYIRTHPEREEVSELAEPEFGWIAPIDDSAREVLLVPEEATALVEWNDGADNDPRSEIRALGPIEHATIINQTTSSLIAQILQHYDAHPEDDGHPAYALYAEWRRRAERAEQDNQPK